MEDGGGADGEEGAGDGAHAALDKGEEDLPTAITIYSAASLRNDNWASGRGNPLASGRLLTASAGGQRV